MNVSINPFEGAGQWYKGNLHCHSTNSDGTLSPEEVFEFYRARGYHFVALTDHHFFSDYGYLNCDDFLVIPAFELSIDQERMPKGEHLCGFQTQSSNGAFSHKQVIPMKPWTRPQDIQESIDFLKENGLAVLLAHPTWSRSDRETLLNASGYFGIEVYNYDSEYKEHTGLSTDYWDFLLRRGRKVWGLATDDAHQYDGAYADGGWVVVKAPELSLEAIMDSLLAGQFYSSSGPELKDFRIEGGTVVVECSPVKAIHVVMYEKRGRSFRAAEGETLTSATWKLQGEELYVRVECEDDRGRVAWSNPIFYNPEFLRYLNNDYLM
jgi:hypothetical protein